MPAWVNPALVLLSLLAVLCIGAAVWLAVVRHRTTTSRVPARKILDTFRSAVTETVQDLHAPPVKAAAHSSRTDGPGVR